MPKYRQLYTKIIDSFDFNEMPDDFTRVVWMLLTLILDSEGRGIDNMDWVKSKMFPLRQDVTTGQIADAFKWFAEHKMIVRYEVDGRKYFFIPTFKKYQTGTQKEAKSTLPAPEQLQRNSGAGNDVVGVVESASASALYCIESESVTERKEIFSIYEHEIGILTPMIADSLTDAEKEYPSGWVDDAIREAALSNKRSWKYVEAILKSWKKNGYKVDMRHRSDQNRLKIEPGTGRVL